MNKKDILLSDLFNHGIKLFTSIGRNYDPLPHGTEITIMEKITTIKKFKKCSFICKKQKKSSRTIEEKTSCNTLLESLCIDREKLSTQVIEKTTLHICEKGHNPKGVKVKNQNLIL